MSIETYSVSTDFVGLVAAKPDLYELQLAVEASSIVTPLDGVDRPNELDDVDFHFTGTPSAPEIVTLDNIVSAHTGLPTQTYGDTVALVVENAGAPTADNDVRFGFRTGSIWVNTSVAPREVYICVRNDSGAADWQLQETPDGSLSATEHKALRDLIHFIDMGGPADGFASGAYLEQTPATAFPTSAIWYTDNGKTDKIVEQTVVRNANQMVSTDTWKVYDTDGSSVLVTLVDTYSYSGVFITDITRTWS